MFTLPDLPYTYNALEPYIDEQTMKIHHDKHHGTYVKNLNDVLAGNTKLLSLPVKDLINNLSQVPESIRTKVKNNGGGHANHTMFWQMMVSPSGKKAKAPKGEVANAIKESFGGFSQFQNLFSQAGVGRFGSGWAWVISENGKLSITDTPNQDSPLMNGSTPILGIDVWEHAYYLKYQNRRADYISAWWNVVNWEEVDRLYLETI